MKSGSSTIGFVPTMGALHPGHLALMARARRTCSTLVVSIFVNPLQFGPREDLDRYPRSLRQDLALCRRERVDAVFVPPLNDLYPDDFQTRVAVTRLTRRWEGEYRPTHFEGVATVMLKLLNLVKPHRTFLGQKDYQQYVVVKQLVKDMHVGTKIILCPTVREADGLAWSSRNRYLEPDLRRTVVELYRSLCAGREAVRAGKRRAGEIRAIMERRIAVEPSLRVEYLAVCDPDTLEPVERIKSTVVLLGAVRAGTVRLIDNLLVNGRRTKERRQGSHDR